MLINIGFGLLLMVGVLVILLGFGLGVKDNIRDLKGEFNKLSNIVYEEAGRSNDLFVRDSHKTLRPKTDLLSDEFDKFEQDVWNHFRMLQERIEKLEKSKVES